MKMKTVIEAGRKASPSINDGMDQVKMSISSLESVFSDLSLVKSGEGREAMLEQCKNCLGKLAESFIDVDSTWRSFASTLSDYKYRFKRGKKEVLEDLPGQQLLFDGSGEAQI